MFITADTPLVGDLHSHTIASVHAYSTLRENIEAAKKKGLKVLATTDHGSGMDDAPPLSFYQNLTSLPEEVDGLRLLRGVEANIMDFNGTLDLPDNELAKLDLVISSFHDRCIRAGSVEECTNAYLRVAENPYVDIIGHSGSALYPYDYERVIPVFKAKGKVVEINAHTFICRQASIENCKRIARLCLENQVPILVNSDAHSEFEIASWTKAKEMLEAIHFPEELVLNADLDRLMTYISTVRKRKQA